MEFYKGQSASDQIQGGGSYVENEGMGHEVCNFEPHRGMVYGYVQPPKAKGQPGEGQIKIERISKNEEDFISDMLVVWTATRPEGGTVIVGWYKNATVYRYYQEFKNVPEVHKKNGLKGYRIKAKTKDAVLLAIDERTFEIPRKTKGGMGQANIWYADAPESKALLKEVLKFIAGNRKKVNAKRSRKTDPERNAKVEKSAIKNTIKYFESIGYIVESVEKDNVGWDLEATLGNKKLLIEVKGLSGSGLSVELTPNEYSAFSKEDDLYRLCVVYDALDKPSLLVCRFSKESGSWIVEGNQKSTINIKQKQSASIEIRI